MFYRPGTSRFHFSILNHETSPIQFPFKSQYLNVVFEIRHFRMLNRMWHMRVGDAGVLLWIVLLETIERTIFLAEVKHIVVSSTRLCSAD